MQLSPQVPFVWIRQVQWPVLRHRWRSKNIGCQIKAKNLYSNFKKSETSKFSNIIKTMPIFFWPFLSLPFRTLSQHLTSYSGARFANTSSGIGSLVCVILPQGITYDTAPWNSLAQKKLEYSSSENDTGVPTLPGLRKCLGRLFFFRAGRCGLEYFLQCSTSNQAFPFSFYLQFGENLTKSPDYSIVLFLDFRTSPSVFQLNLGCFSNGIQT